MDRKTMGTGRKYRQIRQNNWGAYRLFVRLFKSLGTFVFPLTILFLLFAPVTRADHRSETDPCERPGQRLWRRR